MLICFQDRGTEVSSLSRDKGTTGQAQNLAMGRDGPGQVKSRTGRAGTAKIRDGTRDKTGHSRKGHSKTGNHSDCPVPSLSRPGF